MAPPTMMATNLRDEWIDGFRGRQSGLEGVSRKRSISAEPSGTSDVLKNCGTNRPKTVS
jgi:hypothetical protein